MTFNGTMQSSENTFFIALSISFFCFFFLSRSFIFQPSCKPSIVNFLFWWLSCKFFIFLMFNTIMCVLEESEDIISYFLWRKPVFFSLPHSLLNVSSSVKEKNESKLKNIEVNGSLKNTFSPLTSLCVFYKFRFFFFHRECEWKETKNQRMPVGKFSLKFPRWVDYQLIYGLTLRVCESSFSICVLTTAIFIAFYLSFCLLVYEVTDDFI